MIRPVEFQGVVQRNQDVASINQNEHEKPFINQENILSETKRQNENAREVELFAVQTSVLRGFGEQGKGAQRPWVHCQRSHGCSQLSLTPVPGA